MNTTVLIWYESPWDTYEKEFSCDLAGDTAIVVHRKTPSKTFALRWYTGDAGVKMLLCFGHLQHENVLSANEYYCNEESVFAICEDLPITLENVVNCSAFANEAQLAAILCQVLDGVSYLMANGLEHRSLKCSNILMGLDGTVQIARLEDIHVRNNTQSQTLEALRAMTTELMEERSEDHSAVGVTDPSRWPKDSDPARFLAATASVRSVDELKKQPLIRKYRGSKHKLIGLARLAIISSPTFYSYP